MSSRSSTPRIASVFFWAGSAVAFSCAAICVLAERACMHVTNIAPHNQQWSTTRSCREVQPVRKLVLIRPPPLRPPLRRVSILGRRRTRMSRYLIQTGQVFHCHENNTVRGALYQRTHLLLRSVLRGIRYGEYEIPGIVCILAINHEESQKVLNSLSVTLG